jgi:bifunctional DNA-binding transcriptional regulator/antitoxin component of YhaV-PrlF toxin-antitoxin module
MPKVSSKRQITLPVQQCREAKIEPGDEYVSYIDNYGRITIIKKQEGAAQGVISHVIGDDKISDEDSLLSGLNS